MITAVEISKRKQNTDKNEIVKDAAVQELDLIWQIAGRSKEEWLCNFSL